MVNWKASENIDRLIATLIAAHPNLKLEYQGMATLFGQGATYDAIEGRFRKYRKMAEELKVEAISRGITELPRGRNNSTSGSTTPRTPRGPRNGITKPPSSSTSTGKGKKENSSRALTSPTKRAPNRNGPGRSIMDAIFLDDTPAAVEHETMVKNEAAEILSGIGGSSNSGFPDVEIISQSTTATTTSTPITKIEEVVEHSAMSSFSSPSTSIFGGLKPDQHPNLTGNGFLNTTDSRFSATPIVTSVCGLSEVNTLDPLGTEPDAFDMSPFYFSQSHGGYEMDDSIYGGTA